mmetsp:Transcript_62340/g.167269  ORF Transcript_62340/g.167269 Transcript_62340/m.167269 type:complete len:224 (+) Transcript_62340:433-1104(+)
MQGKGGLARAGPARTAIRMGSGIRVWTTAVGARGAVAGRRVGSRAVGPWTAIGSCAPVGRRPAVWPSVRASAIRPRSAVGPRPAIRSTIAAPPVTVAVSGTVAIRRRSISQRRAVAIRVASSLITKATTRRWRPESISTVILRRKILENAFRIPGHPFNNQRRSLYDLRKSALDGYYPFRYWSSLLLFGYQLNLCIAAFSYNANIFASFADQRTRSTFRNYNA